VAAGTSAGAVGTVAAAGVGSFGEGILHASSRRLHAAVAVQAQISLQQIAFAAEGQIAAVAEGQIVAEEQIVAAVEGQIVVAAEGQIAAVAEGQIVADEEQIVAAVSVGNLGTAPQKAVGEEVEEVGWLWLLL